MKCCICGKEIIGYGNNAMPVSEGRCCDECNSDFVIPVRLSVLTERDRSDQIAFNIMRRAGQKKDECT